MLDAIIGIFGFAQSNARRAEDRKLYASSALAGIEAVVMEATLMLDYEIPRLRGLAGKSSNSPESLVSSLVTMRGQCEELMRQIETSKSLLSAKGADANVLAELESWAAKCSVMPAQVRLRVQQIENEMSA